MQWPQSAGLDHNHKSNGAYDAACTGLGEATCGDVLLDMQQAVKGPQEYWCPPGHPYGSICCV